MAEFQGIFLSLSADSIDNKRSGWDGRQGKVEWGGTGRGKVGGGIDRELIL